MKLTKLLFCSLLFTASFSSRGLFAADSLSQAEVISVVLRQNPSIKAARAKWEAMKKRVPQARAWEDPRVGVDVERGNTTRFDTFRDAEWMIAQQIPISGKNLSRGRDRERRGGGEFRGISSGVNWMPSAARESPISA